MENKLFCGDNLEVMSYFAPNSIDSIVCDPPYGLGKEPDPFIILKDWIEKGYSEVKGTGFMQNEWDSFVPQPVFWKECFRVLKPGGHMLVFCGTRTQDWMAMSIRLAGFEIRDNLSWLYGQGFPHGIDLAKQIDKLETGITRGKAGKVLSENTSMSAPNYERTPKGDPITEDAKKWEGWNTGLKPACEFITLARKPISEKNIALNVLKWGTGGLNIDACRVELNGEIVPINILESWSGFGEQIRPGYTPTVNKKGRYPSNLLLDEEAAVLLDEQSGESKSTAQPRNNHNTVTTGFENGAVCYGEYGDSVTSGYDDKGGASRFFFVAKASKREKNLGLESFEDVAVHRYGAGIGEGHHPEAPAYDKNFHPTVKPVSLMEYLIKLVTPIGGVCLDPYLGSGTTVVAGIRLGCYSMLGIEKEPSYFELSKSRVSYEESQIK